MNGKCLFACVLVGFVLSSCSDSQAKSSKPEKQIYLQRAAEGRVTENALHPGEYLLILRGVSSYLPYFSEHPGRLTGKVALLEFIEGWDARHQDLSVEHSNAALITVVSEGKDPQHYRENAVILSEPHFDVARDEFIYTIRQVSDSNPLSTNTFSEPLLFIDSW